MVYAVTHILVTILLADIFRRTVLKNNKNVPKYYILIAAIAGLIPDLDILAFYFLYFFGFTLEQVHRTFLHTFFIPMIFMIASGLIYFVGSKISSLDNYKKLSLVFFIFSMGSVVHLFLDLLTGAIIPFYPFLDFQIGFETLSRFPERFQNLIPATIDGIFLLIWIFWLEYKLKIKKFF